MSLLSGDLPSQAGKVVLVTGANSGLGFESTRVLANKGATVIMCCRSLAKGKAARQKLLSITKAGSLDLVEMNLADLTSVINASEEISSAYGRLDILINNAGVMAPPRLLSKQGFELQFAVNHLAHMALTIKLLPLLLKNTNSRVVTVSSGAQYFGRLQWDDLDGKKKYERWSAYSQSKLANVMFGLELDKRLRTQNKKVFSLIAHPGIVRTSLHSNSAVLNGSSYESFLYKNLNLFFQSPEMGAKPQLYAAISPLVKSGQQYGPSMGFWGEPKVCKSAKFAQNEIYREKLWEISKNLLIDYI